MNALITGVYNRSQVVGDFKTSIGGRFYFTKAPQSPTYPYVVFHLIDNTHNSTLAETNNSDGFQEVLCQFNIYSQSPSVSEAGTILGYLLTHYDNQTLTVSGYQNVDLDKNNRVIFGPFWNDDEEEWIYVVEYQLLMQGSDS